MPHALLRGILVASLAVAGGAASPSLAAASGAAIIEDLAGSVPGLEVFDYVQTGQTIKLPAGAMLTLGYVKSCSREVIKGGTIVVGDAGSTVTGGELKKEQLKCSSGLQLSSAQAGKSGAMVFRGGPKKADAPAVAAPAAVGSTIPAFSLSQSGTLVVQRLDQAEPERRFEAKGKILDLGKQGAQLAPGGSYRATLGGASITFSVSSDATSEAGALVNRLLAL